MQISAVHRPGEQTWLWLAKIVTGVLVFVLLAVHLIVNHLVAQGGLLSYADVIAYYANPLIPVMEGGFLIFVVAHALLGTRGIILDLNPAPALMRAIDAALIALGVVASGYGIWLLQVVAAHAVGMSA